MFEKTTRRGFLSAVGAGVSVGGLWHGLLKASPVEAAGKATEPSSGSHLYKSLKWNMVRLEGTIAEKFAVLKEIGYDGVELDSPGDIDAAEALAVSKPLDTPGDDMRISSLGWLHADPALRRRGRLHRSTARGEPAGRATARANPDRERRKRLL